MEGLNYGLGSKTHFVYFEGKILKILVKNGNDTEPGPRRAVAGSAESRVLERKDSLLSQ